MFATKVAPNTCKSLCILCASARKQDVKPQALAGLPALRKLVVCQIKLERVQIKSADKDVIKLLYICVYLRSSVDTFFCLQHLYQIIVFSIYIRHTVRSGYSFVPFASSRSLRYMTCVYEEQNMLIDLARYFIMQYAV